MKAVFSFLLVNLLFVVMVLDGTAAPKKSSAALRPERPAATVPEADKLVIAYLTQTRAESVPQPFFMPLVTERGIQGARLGIVDDNTTGRFTHQLFELKEVTLPPEADVAAAFRQILAAGHRHVLVDLPGGLAAALARLPEAREALIYNVGSSDDGLRGEGCSANLLHLLPSRAMRADALAQYLSKKRWSRIFLATGSTEEDRLYAAAVKRAAQRFGLKIAMEKAWEHRFDERRTPESEVPVFTQGGDYDVLVVADEAGQFGDYLSYRTWLPRPVAGTQGLVPTSWHFTHEQWGALQLQNRFRELAGRWMTEEDYAAWLAVRAIGEAATRVKSLDFAAIKAYLQGDAFSLAGFKGVPLSFRSWDGQLRQPVLLATERSLVAVAPIDGFLHPKNELDTLGYDQPETRCRMSP